MSKNSELRGANEALIVRSKKHHIFQKFFHFFSYLDFYKLLLLLILYNVDNLAQNKYYPDLNVLFTGHNYVRCGNA